MDLSNK